MLKPSALPEIKNSIRTRIENSGQTPASEVHGVTSWSSKLGPPGKPGSPVKLPSDFAFPDREQTGFVTKSDIARDHHKDPVEALEEADIATFKEAAAGQSTLFLYGHVDYCDIFGEPHTTAYCFVYVPNGGLHLPICETYNGEILPKGICQKPSAPARLDRLFTQSATALSQAKEAAVERGQSGPKWGPFGLGLDPMDQLS